MRRLAVVAAALAVLAGCTTGGPDPSPGPSPTPTGPQAGVLRVLGGSELADLKPVLDEAAQATGVRVALDFTGTLDGAEQVASGAADAGHDAIWFSSNRYLTLQPGAQAKLGASTEIMSSPVVLGLRRSVAQRLGWVGRPVTWLEIAAAAGAKQLTYGMTDPSASNTGFSTVVAVATALVGSGSALTVEQAASTTPALTNFFAGQTLAAGSSGFLQDAYVRRAAGVDPGPAVDGLINYESVLLALNATNTLPEPLELIYPADGVVTAEYPLTALTSALPQARDDLRKLTEYLRAPEVQRRIMATSFRRPAVPGVALDPVLGTATLVELPFPTQADVVDSLLTSWFDKVRRPSRTIYVLDTSGSMAEDDRIGQLRSSLAGLAGTDSSLTGQYRRFRGREEVTLLPFSDVPDAPQTFTVAQDDPAPVLAQIAAAGNALQPGGGTAIYGSLEEAYGVAERQIAADPDRFTSIVVMTDGANTAGPGLDEFRAFAGSRPAAVRGVPVFTILFGEGDNAEMTEVATLTGGRAFDARSAPLASVFKEIRGYV